MIYKYKDKEPNIAEDVFLAEGSKTIGEVTLKSGASVWYNAVLRADIAPIVVGKNSNIQENSSLHVDYDTPLIIGDNVTVGHGVVLHGCNIQDNCLIGMGATVLNNAVIGKNSVIGANALIPEGKEIPPNSLVVGVPGKVVRELSDSDIEKVINNARIYVGLAKEHQAIEKI
ncbi:MAG: gamma carbonic anhydrase family protein [Bacillota bacterium]